MREMGSVELLTREGEIEIAKRIEDGLRHMIQAISACPTTIAEILALAERIEKDETRVDEVVDGLIDPNAKNEPIKEVVEEEEEIEEELEAAEEEDEEASNAQTADQLKLKADALKRFTVIRSLYNRMTRALARNGSRSRAYLQSRDAILEELMKIRFGAKQIEALCDSVRQAGGGSAQLRAQHHAAVRGEGADAAPALHQGVPGQGRQPALDQGRDRGQAPVERGAGALRAGDRREAAEAARAAGPRRHPDQGSEGDQPPDVHRRGEGAPGEARDDGGEPAAGDLDRQEIHQPRAAVPRSHPGGQHRPHEGGGQVRIPPRLQVLDLRHVVDPAGDHALDRGPGAGPSASRCT